MEINVEKLVPKDWIVEKIEDDQIKVYYLNKSRGSSPNPSILPKVIHVDKEFMEAVSMYIGDGKLSNDKHHLDFTSKDGDMVKFMLDFFTNRLNLKITGIRYQLRYKIFQINSVEKWAKHLGVPTTKINLQHSKRYKEECISMQISSVILRNIFGKIIERILENDFSNNSVLRRAFLRGLFAAEGSIGIVRKENYISYIAYHLSFDKEEKLANFVQKLLQFEGVTSKQIFKETKGERYIQITNWKNYHKLWKIDLFCLNARKEFKFLSKLKITKFSCKINSELKRKLFLIKHFSQRQLAFLIGAQPNMFFNILNSKRDYVNVEYLIKLSKVASVPLDSIKRNIVEFRVNDITPIGDKEFIDFIFDLKAYAC
tara:strand:+ start:5111 stop:6223 length:1113 start_codon:yes stop_codon:yes gene_type:complete